ncbi:LysR family transcriptional regulator [Ahrensia marina]|uniref:LysR family transcriptional regulator n=1 Tax=Ahrensia marina TaxID=1514904 RepID=UPI0035CFCB7A
MTHRIADLDIRLLRVFVAVVDSGGFSLAVARLNVAESTISQHMSDLETRIGMRLCERGRSGFRMTREGEQVYAKSVELLQGLEQFRDDLSLIKNDLSGTLRLGLADGLISEQEAGIGARLANFVSEHPSLNVEIVIRSPRMLERAVYDGDLLVAIGAEHRRVSGLTFEPLFTERNTLYCGQANPLFDVEDSGISVETLYDQPRIARGYLDRFDQQFFPNQSYCATVHQVEAAAMLILNGPSIGFLPDHFAKPYTDAGHLRALRSDRFTFSSRMGLISNATGRLDPRAKAFCEFLKQPLAA